MTTNQKTVNAAAAGMSTQSISKSARTAALRSATCVIWVTIHHAWRVRVSDMAEKCKSCIVGMIGSGSIKEGYWQQAITEFGKVIDDWNEKTKRFAVPHPGIANKFNYCPQCGNKVEG